MVLQIAIKPTEKTANWMFCVCNDNFGTLLNHMDNFSWIYTAHTYKQHKKVSDNHVAIIIPQKIIKDVILEKSQKSSLYWI